MSNTLEIDDQIYLRPYNGSLTNICVARSIKKIMGAFPELPNEFYDILSERIVDAGFSDERLIDGINNVIDTCMYPRPTIAQFISWDKKVPMFTYDQMLKKSDEAGIGIKFWDYYKSFMLKEKAVRVWIHVNDVKQYNITE